MRIANWECPTLRIPMFDTTGEKMARVLVGTVRKDLQKMHTYIWHTMTQQPKNASSFAVHLNRFDLGDLLLEAVAVKAGHK